MLMKLHLYESSETLLHESVSFLLHSHSNSKKMKLLMKKVDSTRDGSTRDTFHLYFFSTFLAPRA